MLHARAASLTVLYRLAIFYLLPYFMLVVVPVVFRLIELNALLINAMGHKGYGRKRSGWWECTLVTFSSRYQPNDHPHARAS